MGLVLTLESPEGLDSLHRGVCGGPGGSPPGKVTGLCGQVAPVGGLAGDFLRDYLYRKEEQRRDLTAHP